MSATQPNPAQAPASRSTNGTVDRTIKKRRKNRATRQAADARAPAANAPAPAPAPTVKAAQQPAPLAQHRIAKPAARSIGHVLKPMAHSFIEYIYQSVRATQTEPTEIQRAAWVDMFTTDVGRVCQSFAKAA